jgi:arsenite-transporting ATPase
MTKLLLVTGKGGVGKSTTSAALAYHYAEQGMKTILISSDPAHSTDDTVGVKISSTAQEIRPNLWAMNMDAGKAISGRVNKVKEAFAGMFSNLFPNMDMDMVSLSALPGIDEWGACEILGNLMRDEEYELIVFDTAPTGHTLKALTAPDTIKEMLLKIRRMKKKIAVKLLKGIVFKGSDTDELEELLAASCDDIDLLKSFLQDTERTKVMLVSIPTEAGFMEFYRTVNFLKSIDLPADTLIINHMVPDMGSHFDIRSENPAVAMVWSEHQNQQEWITNYQKVAKEHQLSAIGVTRLPYEPKGMGDKGHLKDFADLIIGTEKMKLPGE